MTAIRACILLALCSLTFFGTQARSQSVEYAELPTVGGAGLPSRRPVTLPVPIVFVSRQIQDRGSIYWDVPRDMPGIGPHSRVRPAAPGRLLILDPGAAAPRVLVDGSNPTPASLNLIDVNGPAVSYDGTKIVFAGLPVGNYDTTPGRSVGAWRIYSIRSDGTGLRLLTSIGQNLNYSQFGAAASGLAGFDDYDPVFLPDGRVCFSSTRWPAFAQYSGVRTSNLYVVNFDGLRLHRITSERNGADRPLVDPATGRIVYARWWRNHRFPTDDFQTVYHNGDPAEGYDQFGGLTTDRDVHVGAPNMWRNFWQIMSVGTDGNHLRLWSGRWRSEPDNHAYGGAFAPDGSFYANFFPMFNMTEAAGFGGIRHYTPGPNPWTPVIGVTELTLDHVHPENPVSYGIYNGAYAAEPEVLPDGRVLISWASGINQDYGLYVINSDGFGPRLVNDFPGTAELRARVVAPRPAPPMPRDVFVENPIEPPPALMPPRAEGPYTNDGTFIFYTFNVYSNAPVDWDIVSAPAVGSAATMRFYLDFQRTSPGSFPQFDWPILFAAAPIAPDGSLTQTGLPGNVTMFEQLRGPAPDFRVPTTGGPYPDGASHVAGMNFTPRGTSVLCVGCHAGHSQITVPATFEEARFTNLAPGAAVTVSSARDPNYVGGLVDRRVMKGEIWRYWNSAPGEQQNQWVQLTFRVPVTVRTVRLYNPRFGDDASSTLQVNAATVRLFSDAAATAEVDHRSAGPLSVSGTDVTFANVRARSIRVDLDDVTGTFYDMQLASLAEIEVIARGEAP